jgi:hypothetical protein
MRLALAVLWVAVLAASAEAATTITVPKQQPTIQAAVNAALQGDTIVLSPGVYVENVVVPPGKDGLVIKSVLGATIDGNLNGVQGACLTVGSSNVSVSGIRFRFGSTQIVATAAGLTVTKCTFLQATTFGIDADGDNAVVDSCRFEGPGSAAFRANGAGATLRRSSLRHCGLGGIEASGLNAVVDSNYFAWIDDANAVKVTGDNARVTRNRFTLCDKDCIRITGISSLVELNKADRVDQRLINITGGAGAVVRRNAAQWVEGGITVDGDNSQVLSNRIGHCSVNDAISVTGDNVAVSFNTIVLTWNDSDGVSVTSNTATGGGTVEGNRVFDAAGSGLRLEDVHHLVVKLNAAFRCADDNRPGISLKGDFNTMTACTTTDADNVGVSIDGASNSVTACVSTGASVAGFVVRGAGNTLTSCTANWSGLEGLSNRGTLTAVVKGHYRGDRFDVTNDVLNLATFTDPALTGVSFKSGGSTQQTQF